MRVLTKEYLASQGYEVSTTGHIISHKGRAPRTLKHGINNCGYHVVNLRLEGKSHLYLVHRLVAMVHIPALAGRPYVNHISGDKADNSTTNLEWVTHKENMEHAVANNIGGCLTSKSS